MLDSIFVRYTKGAGSRNFEVDKIDGKKHSST